MSARWGRLSVSAVETTLSAKGCAFTTQVLYAATNVLLFLQAARIEWGLNNGYRKYLLGVARGCGQLVNLNLTILLLFSSRALSSFLRETDVRFILPLDHILPHYHSKIGIILFTMGAAHGIAQIVEYSLRFRWTLGITGGISEFVTAILICLALLLIVVSIIRSIRQKHYEYFYMMHIAGSWSSFALNLIHGQNRGRFTSWKWMVGPLIVYMMDRLMRVWRTRRSHIVIAKNTAGFHGPNVVSLRMQKLFHHEAGQYIEIRVPEISRWEWHPFTIASAPHETETRIYIKRAGSWTSRLYDLFSSRSNIEVTGDVEIHVRGPFGAPAQHVGEYDHVILIAAGVGATPFCSVTKNAQYLLENWMPQPESMFPSSPPDFFAESTVTNGHRPSNIDSNEAAPPPSVARPGSIDAANVPMFSSESDTLYTARDGLTHTESTSSDIQPVRTSPVPAQVPNDDSRTTTNATHQRFSNRVRKITRGATGGVEHTLIGSRGRSVEHMEALNSAYSAQQATETFHTSLNMLVGMNYGGSLTMVKGAQFRQILDDSKRIPPDTVTPERVAGMAVFRSPAFMFLLFMHSVTMTFVVLWMISLRMLNLGVAAALGQVSVTTPGMSLFNHSRILATIDLVLAVLLCILTILPMVIELREVGVFGRHGMEGLILAPIFVFGSVSNALDMMDRGLSVEVLKPLQVFALWPLTAAIVLFRLIRVIRERISGGLTGNRFKDMFSTKSLDFFWTSSTALDDAWILHELQECMDSSVVKLHRHLTQESERGIEELRMSQTERDITRFGRPEWTSVLDGIASNAKNSQVIGIFFCGPTQMSADIQKAATKAMRDSIMRGLQGGAFRELTEMFSEVVPDERSPTARCDSGCNIRFVFREENFS